jgi:predicted 3-demethylubiquinone-9 3-methyltransferase (glyoxalase superfamily)
VVRWPRRRGRQIPRLDLQERSDGRDHFWSKLGDDGDPKAQQCGWLKDRFGRSWQIAPGAIHEMFKSGDAAKTGRLMTAMLQTKKPDIAALQKAFDGA